MRSVGRAIVLAFLAVAPALVAQTTPRRPRGIYAGVNIQEYSKKVAPAQLEAYLISLYQDVLNNPALSGLAIWVNWSLLNPNMSGANAYDWSWLDDVFAQVSMWNSQNPRQPPKTVQLVPLPGFQTPQWVMDLLPSCDGLFQSPVQTPSSSCGQASFSGFVEGGSQGVEMALPLPWNSVYKSYWQTFLTALAARYGSNPAFVSISVAGPTASSEEMILPDNLNSDDPQNPFPGVSIAPNQMWNKLLSFHYAGMSKYQNSDQAFIEEWSNAIDFYGKILSGVTLVVTTGGGLPNLSATGFMVLPAFTADCPTADMDCAAETAILSYFETPTVGGANAKATQEDGMEASRIGNFNLGVQGVKLVSQSTAQFTTAASQVIGGAQFNSSFSNFPLQEGCPSKYPPDAADTPASCNIPSNCFAGLTTYPGCLPVTCIPLACLAPNITQAALASYATVSQVQTSAPQDLLSPEQAAYNVLSWYFNGTAAAPSFGSTTGTAPLNYLQIYAADFQYAEKNVNSPVPVVETSGSTASMSAQDLLDLASQKLMEIAEPAVAGPPAPILNEGTLANGATYAAGGLVPGSWAQVKGTGLSDVTRIWGSSDFAGLGNGLPTELSGVQVNVNNLPAAVYYIDPDQVSFQVPTGVTGTASVVVLNQGVASNIVTAPAATNAPGIFPVTENGISYPAGVFLDGKYVGDPSVGPAFRQAKPGDVIQLFATGLVQTSAGVQPTLQAVAGVTVTIGSLSVPADFAGLVAAGEFQINFTVPQQFASLADGAYPISIQVNGVSSPLTVNSNPPGQLVLPIQP